MNNLQPPPNSTPAEIEAWRNMMESMVTFIKASTFLMDTINNKFTNAVGAASTEIQNTAEITECDHCHAKEPDICGNTGCGKDIRTDSSNEGSEAQINEESAEDAHEETPEEVPAEEESPAEEAVEAPAEEAPAEETEEAPTEEAEEAPAEEAEEAPAEEAEEAPATDEAEGEKPSETSSQIPSSGSATDEGKEGSQGGSKKRCPCSSIKQKKELEMKQSNVCACTPPTKQLPVACVGGTPTRPKRASVSCGDRPAPKRLSGVTCICRAPSVSQKSSGASSCGGKSLTAPQASGASSCGVKSLTASQASGAACSCSSRTEGGCPSAEACVCKPPTATSTRMGAQHSAEACGCKPAATSTRIGAANGYGSSTMHSGAGACVCKPVATSTRIGAGISGSSTPISGAGASGGLSSSTLQSGAAGCVCKPVAASTPIGGAGCVCKPVAASTPIGAAGCVCKPVAASTPIGGVGCVCKPAADNTTIGTSPSRTPSSSDTPILSGDSSSEVASKEGEKPDCECDESIKEEDCVCEEEPKEPVPVCACPPTEAERLRLMNELAVKLVTAQEQISTLQRDMGKLQRMDPSRKILPGGGPNPALLYKEIMKDAQETPGQSTTCNSFMGRRTGAGPPGDQMEIFHSTKIPGMTSGGLTFNDSVAGRSMSTVYRPNMSGGNPPRVCFPPGQAGFSNMLPQNMDYSDYTEGMHGTYGAYPAASNSQRTGNMLCGTRQSNQGISPAAGRIQGNSQYQSLCHSNTQSSCNSSTCGNTRNNGP